MKWLSFHEYNLRFETIAREHGFCITKLENGSILAKLGNDSEFNFTVISGLHGDERSGPLAILNWLEKLEVGALTKPAQQICLAPLLNNKGWDANKREWNGVDLNRAFKPGAPFFLLQLMSELIAPLPKIFLDFHEDIEINKPYIFRLSGENGDLEIGLQAALEAEDVLWEYEEQWIGSSEVYLRNNGCNHCATIEAPEIWELDKRIGWDIRALDWCIQHLQEFKEIPLL